jgi:DNA-binding transcriptional regulator YiaG
MTTEKTLPNIAAVLKEEISRLARREVKAQTQTLQKAVAQYRRDIAVLKRHSSALKAQVVALERKASKGAPSPAVTPTAGIHRYSAKSVVAHRTRLGISAADYGALVGVTGHTIYGWEHGAARPRKAQIAALAAVRGLAKREAHARLAQLRQRVVGNTRRKKR